MGCDATDTCDTHADLAHDAKDKLPDTKTSSARGRILASFRPLFHKPDEQSTEKQQRIFFIITIIINPFTSIVA